MLDIIPGGGGGTPSVKVVDRLPGTCWLYSWWAPKKGGLKSMSGWRKGSKMDFSIKTLKNGGLKWIFSSDTLKKGGLKSIFFPSALKKGVYTSKPAHHPHIMSTRPSPPPRISYHVMFWWTGIMFPTLLTSFNSLWPSDAIGLGQHWLR